MKTFLRKKHSFLYLVLVGLLSGFTNGLLGNGGGIVIVLFLTPLVLESGGESRDVFSLSLAVMLPISAISAINYARSGEIYGGEFAHFALPAAVGGVIGAFLLDRIRLPFLKKLFAILVIWSGVYMVFF